MIRPVSGRPRYMIGMGMRGIAVIAFLVAGFRMDGVAGALNSLVMRLGIAREWRLGRDGNHFDRTSKPGDPVAGLILSYLCALHQRVSPGVVFTLLTYPGVFLVSPGAMRPVLVRAACEGYWLRRAIWPCEPWPKGLEATEIGGGYERFELS